jgi:V/A-type H+-transporting ATPase subunit C
VLDVSRYSAANALIRARLSRRISRQTWERLLLASGLQEALEVLMGSVYRETLASVPVEEPDAGDIECRLREYMARGFRAPLPFLPGDTRKLLDWRWRRFEVDNLKMILRAVERNVPPGEIRNTLVPLGLASELPWDSLSESISVSALVERLGDSFYAQMLKPALDVYRRDGQLFVLEIRLDLTYLQRLRSII